MDIIKSISIKGRSLKTVSGLAKPRKVEVTVVLALGFGLSTRVAAVVSTNSAFCLGDTSKTNLSNTERVCGLRLTNVLIPILPLIMVLVRAVQEVFSYI